MLTDKTTRSIAESVKQVMGLKNLKEGVNPQLVNQMNKILADAYLFYFKAHQFHWNVEGANFPQYHEFFSKVYEQAFANLDPIAEQIRALGSYTQISLGQIVKTSGIMESISVESPSSMFSSLLADNASIINGLTVGYKLAEASGEAGLSNFLQDLIDKHKKLAWMLTSTSKGV